MIQKSHIDLKANESDLKGHFKKLSSFNDVATILEISPNFLQYILYKNKTYSVFNIPKRNGLSREIKSPNTNLRIIQKKLSYILSLNYSINKSVHGFVKNRGIKSNAKLHANQNYVLNFDLKDYFHQINQGRVIGFFKKYYNFNNVVAGTLAEICCFENILAQGAPTSPIMANILSFSLDKQMARLCKEKKCVYSRYADDITISTNKEKFPRRFAYIKDNETIIGSALNSIVEESGFEVNTTKNRLRNNSQSQSVTGITVNKFLNVDRNYIRKIRAILHNFKVNDEELAKEIFFKNYHPRHKRHKKGKDENDMYNVVKGMIEFVSQIKGREDSIYRKLAISFNQLLLPKYVLSIDYLTKTEKDRRKNCFVIDLTYYKYTKGSDKTEIFGYTASAFLLKGIGIITSAHTFKDYLNNIDEIKAIGMDTLIAFRANETSIKRNLKVVYRDYDLDFAICNIEGINYENYGFDYSTYLSEGQQVTLLGFPKYKTGNQLNSELGQVNHSISERFDNKFNIHTGEIGVIQKRFGITSTIFSGNSGGPILNDNNQVIGIATKGVGNQDVQVNTIIPISDVIDFKKNKRLVHS